MVTLPIAMCIAMCYTMGMRRTRDAERAKRHSKMKTINSLDEILKLAESGNLYVRWSRGPEMDKRQGNSRDYVSGGHHNGLSCQRISANNSRSISAMMLVEYQFLCRKDSKIYGWLFLANENGKDSDNAPTVDAASIVPVGKLSEELVNRLSEYNAAYWTHQRTTPKTWNDRLAWLDSTPNLKDFVAE